ncbi:MAG: hypothetical protein Q7T17_08300 [Microbacterium sp.]|uniref:hypothetical protein n=1 Tax=Microbacterium sp. TaxID=51671 RepID=UPI0027213283|nr:hypothetical protein [Microbacterium sp.]MDO8382963.1 hypothetical protein [Microbacterium sp.]
MWGYAREMLDRSSIGEIFGTAVISVAVVALLCSAMIYASGDELAFFGLLAAFAGGTTGVGIHVASREARLRRARR